MCVDYTSSALSYSSTSVVTTCKCETTYVSGEQLAKFPVMCRYCKKPLLFLTHSRES